jgi:hypothetical protein
MTQDGIVLARDARRLGWSWDDLYKITIADGGKRLFRSAYLLPGIEDSPLVRARTVQLLRPQAVASHELAAYIHMFALVRDPKLQFTGNDKSRRDIPGGQLFRWLLSDEDVEQINGLWVTTKLRTAVDLLRQQDRDVAVIAVDSALRSAQVSLDAIAARLELLTGDPFVRRAWKRFGQLDPKSDSPTESKVRMIMCDRDVHPQTQVPVLGPGGETYYLDFLAGGVAFEAEGFKYHGTPEAHEADVGRFNSLGVAARSNGLDFARITFRNAFAQTLRTGDMIVRTIAARRRRLGGGR